MDYQKRIKLVQQQLRRRKIDALLISEPANRRYLSGYSAGDHGIAESSGYLLIPRHGDALLLTDSRFQLQAEQEVPWMKVLLYPKGLIALLEEILPALRVMLLAFEGQYTLYTTYLSMKDRLQRKNVVLQSLSGLIERMREIKDEEEIAVIRASVAMNEAVFQQIFPKITTSQSEIDLALAIETLMRQKGAEGPSFPTIVASGENSAKPHAVPSRTKIVSGRPLTIDMGLILKGYCSDMTRTFAPGKPDNRYLELHRLVRRAQLAGIRAIREGITGKEVDTIARKVIDDAGYGTYFGHGLGHGVGLQVHEMPRLSINGTRKLQAGMIVTIEPGIYIPGWGGIRLENMAVVREGGCEILNRDSTWLDI